MDERMREAFAQVRAEEALKQRTLSYLARQTNGWSTAPRRRVRPLLTAAACAACLLMTLGSLWLYFTPSAYISVDVNPSLELTVNRFDRVIAVTGRNDDGTALAETLDIRFLNYSQALEQVLDSAPIAASLARDEILSITVAGDDETRTAQILTQVTACTSGRGTADCRASDLQTAKAAHSCGLSCGKYQMLLELQALDPTVTAVDVREQTMRQLQDWLTQLESSDGDTAQRPQGGYGQSAGQSQAGQGQVSGHGHSHGHHGEGS